MKKRHFQKSLIILKARHMNNVHTELKYDYIEISPLFPNRTINTAFSKHLLLSNARLLFEATALDVVKLIFPSRAAASRARSRICRRLSTFELYFISYSSI